jgi:hypothetical protein
VSARDGAVRIQDKHGNLIDTRGRYSRKSFRDGYPLTPAADVAAIKAEETRRIDAMGELPDIDITCFESLEEYQQWLMDGAPRFAS